MSGAVMNYDFGPKRHWRRWVWNRIAEKVDAKHSLCVYLAGANDYDRPVAIAKGFRGGNLVAVERDAVTRDLLRERGVLTIDADFISAVDAAALGRRVDVVLADLCCGLRWEAIEAALRWFCLPNLRNATFAFNLMRGRDPETNEMRASITHLFPAKREIHRGKLLLHRFDRRVLRRGHLHRKRRK